MGGGGVEEIQWQSLSIICRPTTILEDVSTMNVSLTDELREFVQRRVDEGGYTSTSEYVRALIRFDRDRRTLRDELLDGARSPIEGSADTAYFDGLRRQLDIRS